MPPCLHIAVTDGKDYVRLLMSGFSPKYCGWLPFRREPYSVCVRSVNRFAAYTEKCFNDIQESMKGYVYLPFLVVVMVCWVFFFLFMPETKNRTFDEVARDLAFGTIVVGRRTAALQTTITSRLKLVLLRRPESAFSEFELPELSKMRYCGVHFRFYFAS
ncbi:unnamed protein product [Dibothriocephalus latus]|uniref:Major facilitator superfamily (MFS) profile domain-containing protein n=1 Tax=Dibothriocephalus latus TaxID=60516 RepID=A0A3P7M9E9_DIBLA|nr:unnamed protein product [Dibothriocephalus latus]